MPVVANLRKIDFLILFKFGLVIILAQISVKYENTLSNGSAKVHIDSLLYLYSGYPNTRLKNHLHGLVFE